MIYKESIVFFDGECNLCNSSVQFILKHDKKKTLKFSSLQSDFSKELLSNANLPTQDFDTIYLYQKGEILKESAAIFGIIRAMSSFRWLLIFRFLPKSLLDFFYKIIAKNRKKWFGISDKCILPNPEFKGRFIK